MSVAPLSPGPPAVLDRQGLAQLIQALRAAGYQVFGPTRQDGAIVYGELSSAADLPAGWTDEQAPGRYRLSQRADDAVFGYAVGPHSWKQLLHPPVVRLWQARREGARFQAVPEAGPEATARRRFAFFGARPCEVHALAIQDKVFLGGPVADPVYARHRDSLLVVAVQCTQPAATCFCASLGTGPKARGGFDLALTELLEAGRHEFLVEVGSERGAALLAGVARREATEPDQRRAEDALARAAGQMQRALEPAGLQDLLYRNHEHPRWDDVAGRCLSCANCTMVCPTCFCTTVEDRTDLSGELAERWRKWDSCFTLQFSYIHGGSVRASTKARYRQWLTHKLATWQEQFGACGCVGCGRCISWCPVGIDLTQEIAAIRLSDGATNRKEGTHGH